MIGFENLRFSSDIFFGGFQVMFGIGDGNNVYCLIVIERAPSQSLPFPEFQSCVGSFRDPWHFMTDAGEPQPAAFPVGF